jgi:hypothetical protein
MMVNAGLLTSLTGRSAAVTATSFTNTSHAATYTPTSAANIVKVTCTSGVLGGISSGSIDVVGRLINSTSGAAIGSEIETFNQNTTQISNPVTWVGYDKPNSISAQTYTCQCRIITAGATVWIGSTSLASPSTQFLFEELVT